MDKKKVIVLVAAVFITSALSASFITYKLTKNNELNEIYIPESEYSDILSYFEFEDIKDSISQFCVTETEPSTLSEAVKASMVSSIGDEYSRYYPEELFTLIDSGADGSNIVLGAALRKNDDGEIEVAKVYPDSPASNAGIAEGDMLTHIGGKNTEGMDLSEAILRLTGQEGTEVEVWMQRGGEEQIFSLTRKTASYEVVFTDVPAEGIGLVEIFEFSQNSASQLEKALSQLKKENINKLVIDLRDTNGGFASQAIDAADLFIDKGVLALSLGKEKNEWQADRVLAFDGEIIIITNSETSGAAEVFAAAMQANSRAKLVGENTNGSVPVFSYVQLPNSGNGLKLVSGYFHKPDGEAIESVGIKPDIEVFTSDETSLENDAPLQAAIRVLNES